MRRLGMLVCLIAAFSFAVGRVACAQNWGGGGTSAFGSSMGGSGFGSSSFGNAGFGGSRFGSSGIGSSSFGNSGMGGSRFGNSSFGTSTFGMSNSMTGGQSLGSGGYGGGQNFVGRDSADMASTFNQMGQAGTQFFNQMNRNMSRSQRSEQPAALANPPQPVRVEIQVAFRAPRPSSAAVGDTLRIRLGKILSEHEIAQPTVTMAGDTAVLGGVAATESQRLVLEKLVSLEAGVRQVRNEMTVNAQPAAPAAQPGS
jgi:hypothetical protein